MRWLQHQETTAWGVYL